MLVEAAFSSGVSGRGAADIEDATKLLSSLVESDWLPNQVRQGSRFMFSSLMAT